MIYSKNQLFVENQFYGRCRVKICFLSQEMSGSRPADFSSWSFIKPKIWTWYNQFMSWVELLFFLHTFTAIRQKRSVDFGNAASCCAPVKINGYSEFTTILTPLTYTLLNTLLSERINILRFCPLISNGHVHWSPTDRRSLLWVARDPCFL